MSAVQALEMSASREYDSGGGGGDARRPFSVGRVLVDVLAFAAVCAVFVVFDAALEPYERGYFCDDESIRYAYKSSTVPASINYVVWFAAALILIGITEVHAAFAGPPPPADAPQYKFGRYTVRAYLVHIYEYAGYMLLGAAVTKACFDVGKICAGRLRPNFLHVCRPADETVALCARSPRAYVAAEAVHCRGAHTRESRLSFPSGHAAFSCYAALFVLFYLHYRAKWTVLGSRLPVAMVQLAGLLYAFVVCLSRISDNKHHATDVLAGALLGLFVALFTVFIVGKMHAGRPADASAPASCV